MANEYKSINFAVKIILLTTLFLVFLFTTNPFNSSLVITIVPFVIVFMFFRNIFLFIFALIFKEKISNILTAVALFLASLPVLVLVLSSLGQLTIRDLIISVVLIGVSSFYISRASFIKN